MPTLWFRAKTGTGNGDIVSHRHQNRIVSLRTHAGAFENLQSAADDAS